MVICGDFCVCKNILNYWFLKTNCSNLPPTQQIIYLKTIFIKVISAGYVKHEKNMRVEGNTVHRLQDFELLKWRDQNWVKFEVLQDFANQFQHKFHLIFHIFLWDHCRRTVSNEVLWLPPQTKDTTHCH